MTRFESYRWEDHAPRPGRWRVDLGMTIFAIGLLLVAFPDAPRFDFPTFPATIDRQAPAASRLVVDRHGMAATPPRVAARTFGSACPEAGSNTGS
jgi:hypothetical protein